MVDCLFFNKQLWIDILRINKKNHKNAFTCNYNLPTLETLKIQDERTHNKY